MANPQLFIEIACKGGTSARKTVQMKIAEVMQEWAAAEINERLEAHRLDIRAKPKGRRYRGGWRSVSVDVHIQTDELGLVLALDPKHLQSKSSIMKNWKNMLNDLIAFAGNIHTRFPMCVVGGMVGFEKSQADPQILDEMYSIVGRVAMRNSPSEQNALLEAFGIVVYECNPPRLVPDTPSPNSQFRAGIMFDRMVTLLVQRYVA